MHRFGSICRGISRRTIECASLVSDARVGSDRTRVPRIDFGVDGRCTTRNTQLLPALSHLLRFRSICFISLHPAVNSRFVCFESDSSLRRPVVLNEFLSHWVRKRSLSAPSNCSLGCNSNFSFSQSRLASISPSCRLVRHPLRWTPEASSFRNLGYCRLLLPTAATSPHSSSLFFCVALRYLLLQISEPKSIFLSVFATSRRFAISPRNFAVSNGSPKEGSRGEAAKDMVEICPNSQQIE